MLLAFVGTAPRLSAHEEASRAELDALRAIGVLTRLAGSAPTAQDAERVSDYITRIQKSAQLAELTAAATADERRKGNR